MTRLHLLAVLSAAALACGKNIATSHNDPGTGTSTLLVTGDIDGEISSGSPVTNFSVTVRDGASNKVSGAQVGVFNLSLPGGSVQLVETQAGSGKYVNSVAQFPSGDFGLSVVRNTDKVEGVVVGGPGMHAINAPATNATVAANQPLPVSWTTPTQSKQATIWTRDFSGVSTADTGAYTIAGAQNPANPSQRLFVSRFNEVDAAGGLAGSRLRVTFTASVDPFTVQ